MAEDNDAEKSRPDQRCIIHRHDRRYRRIAQRLGDAELAERAEDADAEQIGPGLRIMPAAVDEGADGQRGQGVDGEPEDRDDTGFGATQHADHHGYRRRDQRAAKRNGCAKCGDQRSARLDHDQHADKADQDRRPATDTHFLAQEDSGKQGGENRHGETDRRGIGQRQQRHRPEVEAHGKYAESRTQDMEFVLVRDDRGPAVLAAHD